MDVTKKLFDAEALAKGIAGPAGGLLGSMGAGYGHMGAEYGHLGADNVPTYADTDHFNPLDLFDPDKMYNELIGGLFN